MISESNHYVKVVCLCFVDQSSFENNFSSQRIKLAEIAACRKAGRDGSAEWCRSRANLVEVSQVGQGER